ncbi:MAG: FkbM family methyltransferase [Anaerolineales bacterium]|nr:FkbM family methyltransferase [Anaerolineales bacterium]
MTDSGLPWRGAAYEGPTLAALLRCCTPEVTTFFDIGANFGYYSYYLLHNAPALVIYRFEPNPKNYALMLDAKLRNGWVHFYPQNIGLGDAEAVLPLHLGARDRDSGHATFVGANAAGEGAGLTARVTCFDTWTAEQGLALPSTPQWIAKIDVEGFEMHVLHGMRRALEQRAFAAICIEMITHSLQGGGVSTQQVATFFADCGYQPFDEALEPTTVSPDEFRNVFFLPTS